MGKISALQMGVVAMLAGQAVSVGAQLIPPAGYSGNGAQPGVGVVTDPNAPVLIRIPDARLSGLFHVDPDYRRGAATGHVKVVGAFQIAETKKRRLVAAWSAGFLPVTLSFSDGECFSLQADYMRGTLSNGRLSKVRCDSRRDFSTPAPPSPPPGRSLKLLGSPWGYSAWVDDNGGFTIITVPFTKTFQPLFTAKMSAIAVMAMNGPDYPGGNVTLVGRIQNRLTVITLEVSY